MSDNGDRSFITRLNERFASIAGWSYDYRWIVILLALGILWGSLVLAARAPIDNSYESYFDTADPAYRAYEQYRDDFGSDEVSYILYDAPDSEHGAWNLEVMRQIDSLTAAIEDEAPFVYSVKSLVNVELIEGVPDGIEIADLTDDFPATQAELLAVRERVLSKPQIVGGLASADGSHGALTIKMDRSSTDPPEDIQLDPEKGNELENLYPQATDSKIEQILARPEYQGIRFFHAGDVPLNSVYNRLILVEGSYLDRLTSLVIGLLLLLAFRSITGTLAPIAVVQLCVLMCAGFIGLLGWKLDMSFGSIPTLLTAIGIAHSVHILSEFRGRFAELGDRREALVRTVYLVGAPCLMTSLTTAVGFASLSFVPIKSIAHQGVYAAFGVMAAFLMSFTLLMALLSMGRREMTAISGVLAFGLAFTVLAAAGAAIAAGGGIAVGTAVAGLTYAFEHRRRSELGKGGQATRRVLLAIAEFDLRHRKAILASFFVVFVLCGLGIRQIVVDSNWLDDFSSEVPLKGITERVDRVMGGSTNIIYLFDSGEPDGIKNPAVLREMERIHEIAGKHEPFVRKAYSLVDILKDLNQAFHGGDPAYYELPETRALVAQYLLLYEMSGGEDAEEFVSSDYQRASVELRLALHPTSKTAELVEAIDAELTAKPLETSEVSLTGIGALWIILLDYIVSSQIQGFLLAFVVIAVMMIAIFRSLGTGLISMIPNIAPSALALGVMGWAGIWLDYSKISIAAVAIGIAVDDTIHLVSRYRHEFTLCGDYAEALRRAIQDVGRALLITSAALISGFLVLTASALDSQATYGILLATTIVTALIADFLLMPALVLTFHPFGPEKPRPEGREPA